MKKLSLMDKEWQKVQTLLASPTIGCSYIFKAQIKPMASYSGQIVTVVDSHGGNWVIETADGHRFGAFAAELANLP